MKTTKHVSKNHMEIYSLSFLKSFMGVCVFNLNYTIQRASASQRAWVIYQKFRARYRILPSSFGSRASKRLLKQSRLLLWLLAAHQHLREDQTAGDHTGHDPKTWRTKPVLT